MSSRTVVPWIMGALLWQVGLLALSGVAIPYFRFQERHLLPLGHRLRGGRAARVKGLLAAAIVLRRWLPKVAVVQVVLLAATVLVVCSTFVIANLWAFGAG